MARPAIIVQFYKMTLLLQNDTSWQDLRPSQARAVSRVSQVLADQMGKVIFLFL